MNGGRECEMRRNDEASAPPRSYPSSRVCGQDDSRTALELAPWEGLWEGVTRAGHRGVSGRRAFPREMEAPRAILLK